ncbi:TIGR02234 family membrane protein [Streptomyces sp. A7024]|uniref:TIGR02234 family membrane protein n=1 Tax=Streptomyces coryli TaxID=1128680 RepID=A0A6G4U3X1_9ACTN|nr:TIGR02234 family membrane protein [Streptomyces coryli]
MTQRSTSRKPLAIALFGGALGAAVVLLSSGRTWAEGAARTAVADSVLPVSASGRDVTAAPSALAVVGLAALVAVFAVRGPGRRLVAALLALAGAGTVAAAVVGARDSGALAAQAAEATGLSSADVANVTHTGWPWVAVAGGALLLLAGALALRYGADWPAMSGRYERSGVPAPRRAKAAPDPDRPEELWKALDRGEDPTGRA